MRAEEEIQGALAYWTKARDDAEADRDADGNPRPGLRLSPSHILMKGIVWALEWANGRDVNDIIQEAGAEPWIAASTT